MDGEASRERLEVLDGSPREVIRTNEEVICDLPQDKVVISDQRGRRKSFPALLPERLSGIAEHYDVQKGGVGRVAGLKPIVILARATTSFRHSFGPRPVGAAVKART